MILFFFRLLSVLPLSVLHTLGALLGRSAYLLSPKLRHDIKDHLQQAGYDDPALARRAAAEAGKSMLELPFVWLRPQQDLLKKTKAQNWELSEQARSQGRGVIFITAHLGCFEMTAQYFAIHEAPHPVTVLYRQPRQRALRALVEARQRSNLYLAPADLTGVKRLVRALRQNQAIGLLPDQVPSKGEGVFARHFGRMAYTMTLPSRLQTMSGAVVLLASGERLRGARGWLVKLEPFPEPLSGSEAERAEQINRALEVLIRRCPEQYLWGYRRYKLPPGVSRPA